MTRNDEMDEKEEAAQDPAGDGDQHPLLVETLHWLTTPEALAAAKAWARARKAIGVKGQDLLSVAYDHVVLHFHHELERSDGPRPANEYGNSVLSTVLKELYREVGHVREKHLGDHINDGGGVADPQPHLHQPKAFYPKAPDQQREPLLDAERFDELRAAIESIVAEPWEKAAALSYVTLVGYPAIDRKDIPKPVAGATPLQGFEWAGMWLAGVRDIFPDESGDPPAQRTKRNRRQKNVRAVIAQARALVDGREEKR